MSGHSAAIQEDRAEGATGLTLQCGRVDGVELVENEDSPTRALAEMTHHSALEPGCRVGIPGRKVVPAAETRHDNQTPAQVSTGLPDHTKCRKFILPRRATLLEPDHQHALHAPLIVTAFDSLQASHHGFTNKTGCHCLSSAWRPRKHHHPRLLMLRSVSRTHVKE